MTVAILLLGFIALIAGSVFGAWMSTRSWSDADWQAVYEREARRYES